MATGGLRDVDWCLLGAAILLAAAHDVAILVRQGTVHVFEPAEIRTFVPRIEKSSVVSLHSEDEILSVNGKPLRSASEWRRAVRGMRLGDELRIRLRRGGEELDAVLQSTFTKWWEPLAMLLRLFPLVIWVGAASRQTHPAARWSRTALLSFGILAMAVKWLATPVPLIAHSWMIAVPTLLALSMSAADWALYCGLALSLAQAVLSGAAILWSDYSSVPAAWAGRLDLAEALLPLNLFFWMLVPLNTLREEPRQRDREAEFGNLEHRTADSQ